MSETIEITVSLQDSSLSDEEKQAQLQFLMPQIREVEGVEKVSLASLQEMPEGTKTVSGFLIGTFNATVNATKLRPLWQFLGSKMSDKTLEATFKKDGREFIGKASTREDFDYLITKAEEFFGNE